MSWEDTLLKALNRFTEASEGNTEHLDKLEREPEEDEEDFLVEFRYIADGDVLAEQEVIITGTYESVEKETLELREEYLEFIELDMIRPMNGQVKFNIMEA